MSLINEALKRTRDASYQSAQPPPSPATPPPAITPSYQSPTMKQSLSYGSRAVIIGTICVLVLSAVAGVVYLLAVRYADDKNVTQFSTIVPQPTTIPSEIESPASIPSIEPEAKTSEPIVPPINHDPVVAPVLDKVKAESPVPAVVIPPASPPKLTLQGITRDGKSREAMINGVNVHEGDDIEGARVIAIESRSVKLQFAGNEFTLRIP